jgi:hypothetical protein
MFFCNLVHGSLANCISQNLNVNVAAKVENSSRSVYKALTIFPLFVVDFGLPLKAQTSQQQKNLI